MKSFTLFQLALVSFYLTVQLPATHCQTLFTKVTDTNNPIVSYVPTGGYTGASWTDYNNDDWLDLFTNDEFLFKNNGDGTFTQIASSVHGITSGHVAGEYNDGHAWGDFDNDGWTDVYMANKTSALFKNNGDGTFTQIEGIVSTGVNAWAAAFGDYDEDGWLDIVAVHPRGFIGANHVNWLFKSDGTGGFTSVSNDVTAVLDAYTVGSWSDFDLDGDLDLFIGSGEANISNHEPDNMYFNQLSQTGSADLVKSNCPGLCTDNRDGQNWNWIDFDNDGDLDGFVTNYTKSNDFYRNDSGGNFHKLTATDLDSDLTTLLTGAWLTNVWEDFDNDGDLDIYLGNDGGSDLLYLNAAGKFTKTTQPFSVAGGHRGASAGDYDKDGSVDIFISANSAPGKGLYQNNGNANVWISLDLEGTATNRSALGTIVRAKASIGGVPVWQMRETSSQNSFCGANSPWAHFGFGDAVVIDSLVVIWTNGEQEAFTGVAINQFCSIKEGEGMTCLLNPVKNSFLKSAEFNLYPNPAGGELVHIEFEIPRQEDVRLEIIAADGRLVWKKLLENVSESHLTVEKDTLPSGVYFVRLTAAAEFLTRRLVL